jgi:ribonucleoside-triphosphate reductase
MAAPQSGIRVVKTSGDIEIFDPNVITQQCIEAGIELYTAAEVAMELSKAIYDGISTKEIQERTLEILYREHPEAAERYKRFHSMLVRTSRNTIEPFNRKKIARSLIRETKLPRELANMIAKESEAELRRLKLDFVSAPLVREVVNVKLLEHGFEEARADYTRLGMPVYDASEVIEAEGRKDPSLRNPGMLHSHMADSIFKEYALLKALPLHLADAHMRGEIYIHNLECFVLRPASVNHDLRWFLEDGLELGLEGRKIFTGAAKNPKMAFFMASKLLTSAQTNISRRQVIPCFNVLLAPYIRKSSYQQIKELVHLFILNSQLSSRSDLQVGIEHGCPDYLPEYAAFEREINSLGTALTELLIRGDAKGGAITQPTPCYSSRREDFSRGGYEDFIAKAIELAFNFKTPRFTNQGNPLDSRGTLQVITLNLPRAAYSAKGEDDRLFEILDDLLLMGREALMIKREFIEERIGKGLLPFLGIRRKGDIYYSMDRVEHSIGYVGLNEMVKAHTGEELHESRRALNFGLRTLRLMAKEAKEWKRETGLRWKLTTCPNESTSYRLAKLDYGEFSGKAVVNFNEEGKPYYTLANIRRAPGLALKEMLTLEGAFQAFTGGDAPVEIPVDFMDRREMAELSKDIASTGIKTWRFK